MNSAIFQGKTTGPSQWQLTICPNAVLGLGIFMALVFVSYLGRDGVLIFLLLGLAMQLRRLDLALRDIRDYGWLCLLPLWALVSFLWSEHPALSIRHGTQLLITFAIAITVANRLSPLLLLQMLFAALLAAAIASLLIGEVRPDGIWIGIFESKNYYAFTMVVLVLCSFAFLIDPTQPILWRFGGVVGAGLALPQLFFAESIGAIIATVCVIIATIVLLRVRRLPPHRQYRRIFTLCLAMTAFALTLWFFSDAVFALVFALTGKDATLTGRTDLLAVALAEISKARGTGSV